MLNTKKILAVIPARANSKRLPGKNIKNFLGKPLINWTIESALKSKYLDTVLVSTDSESIKSSALDAGADVPFLRPLDLAKDTTTSETVISHAIEWLASNKRQTYDLVVMLQPTSPLRTTSDIDAALELFTSNANAKSLVSFCTFAKNPLWLKTTNADGYLEDYWPKKGSTHPNTSVQPLLPNGALYIIKTATFAEEPFLYTNQTIPFLMPKNRSVDIDDEDDFHLAELYGSENFLLVSNKKESDEI